LARYFKVLPRRLREDYGHSGPYTPLQVDSTLRRHRIGPARHSGYAVALFSESALLPDTWNGRRMDKLREELSTTYFGGSPIVYEAVVSHCSDHFGSADHCDASGAGGFHSSGAESGGHH
jgi:hypothetical protein